MSRKKRPFGRLAWKRNANGGRCEPNASSLLLLQTVVEKRPMPHRQRDLAIRVRLKPTCALPPPLPPPWHTCVLSSSVLCALARFLEWGTV